MLKKTMFAVVALMFAAVLAAPTKASAQVVFRVGVGPVAVVAPAPAPVVVAPAPVAVAPYVVAPGYVYPNVVIGGRWYPRGYAYRGYAPHYNGWRR